MWGTLCCITVLLLQIALTTNVPSPLVSRLTSSTMLPRRWLVLAMLLPLHIAALLGIEDPAELEQEAEHFLDRAMQQLSALPWVSGITWQSVEGSGKLGKESNQMIKLASGQLQIVFFTRYPVSTSVRLHAHLLTQLINRFHEAKRREHTLRQMARMQAIYETGSRLAGHNPDDKTGIT